ncbi:MAG TPA: UbiA family prenyltransferase, partial [Opitutus sp.]|nr:UbiA family prenyltransferase [Opitutus sp.]
GSAAAGDVLHPSALLLAAVLVFWQMPHFFAIGWMYRRDYYAAGFPLLPATDPTGVRTARWSLGYTFGLIAVSLLGAPAAQVGPIYYAAALLGGAFFLERAWRFLRDERRRDEAARRLFLASICYLPLLLSALLLEWILG